MSFQAATFGAGCWAAKLSNGSSMACSISGSQVSFSAQILFVLTFDTGSGEAIIRFGVGRAVGLKLQEGLDPHDALEHVLNSFCCALPYVAESWNAYF